MVVFLLSLIMLLSFILRKDLVKCRCRIWDKGYKCVGGVLNEGCDFSTFPLLRVVNSLKALQGPTETSLSPNRLRLGFSPSASTFFCMDWTGTLLVRLDVKFGEETSFFFSTSHWFKLMLLNPQNFHSEAFSVWEHTSNGKWSRSPREPLFPFPYLIFVRALSEHMAVCVHCPPIRQRSTFIPLQGYTKGMCQRSPRKAVIE